MWEVRVTVMSIEANSKLQCIYPGVIRILGLEIHETTLVVSLSSGFVYQNTSAFQNGHR